MPRRAVLPLLRPQPPLDPAGKQRDKNDIQHKICAGFRDPAIACLSLDPPETIEIGLGYHSEPAPAAEAFLKFIRIRLLDFAHMDEENRVELEQMFRQDYLPLLSSFIVSKKQAFPFLKSKGIYAVAVLSTKAEKKKIGIVPCGGEIFPRLVPVPGRTGCFILSEELILHFLPLLYKGYKISSKTLARITRNADINADLIYDEDLNYRDHMAEVVDALVEAAENGKQVDVLVELKARFDEENNIEWSRLLERAGCHVVYGIEGLKVHSKLCLITRKTKEGISFITQIGTGNYNEKTSRLYTDLSFLTASHEIGMEATEVFRALDQGETVDSVKNLLVAPHCLQNRLLDPPPRGDRFPGQSACPESTAAAHF